MTFDDSAFRASDDRLDKHGPIRELRDACWLRVRAGEAENEVSYSFHRVIGAYATLMAATHKDFSEADFLDQWHHRDAGNIVYEAKNKIFIERAEVEESIAEYLRQDIRVLAFDRAFIDACMIAEMVGFIKSTVFVWQTSKWRYLLNLLSYGLNIIVAVILFNLSDGALWAQIVAAFIVIFPFVKPLLLPSKKNMGHLLMAMLDAYRLLDGPITSVRELRLSVEKARDLGVVWPASLWPLLEDIESRSASV